MKLFARTAREVVDLIPLARSYPVKLIRHYEGDRFTLIRHEEGDQFLAVDEASFWYALEAIFSNGRVFAVSIDRTQVLEDD